MMTAERVTAAERAGFDLAELARRVRGLAELRGIEGPDRPIPDGAAGARLAPGQRAAVLTLAALALADLAVASCSGPAHLAQAVGTPLLALYGPTDPDAHLWTLGAVALVSRRCELRPCGRASPDGCPTSGPLGRLQPCLDPRAPVPRGACMDMAPGDVAAAAFWLLARRGGPVPRLLVAGELLADGPDGG